MRRLPAQRVIREQLEPQREYDMTKTMTLFRQRLEGAVVLEYASAHFIVLLEEHLVPRHVQDGLSSDGIKSNHKGLYET